MANEEKIEQAEQAAEEVAEAAEAAAEEVAEPAAEAQQAEPAQAAQAEAPAKKGGVSRREALVGVGALALGAVVSGLGVSASERNASAATIADKSEGKVVENVMRMTYPFRGERQSGIYEAQQSMFMATFDMLTEDRDQLISLLKNWTKAAENMTMGYPVNEPEADKYRAPMDTGEAYDLGPAGLTVTFAFGASMFETEDGKDRYGLAKIKPERLVHKMRAFPGDALIEEECGGDLFIKCAAEDPQVAFHALHNLVRLAYGTASIKWTKNGYIRTYSPEGLAYAPRDPFGFRDGTSNPEPGASPEDDELIENCVWIHADDPQGEYFENGTFLNWRTFAGKMESWDNQTLEEQERVIGRTKLEGIPLSGGEDDSAEVDLSATDEAGNFLIDPRSHIATLRAIRNETGHVMYRFGWNFEAGIDRLGNWNAGMHTGGYARDPEADFYVFMDAFLDCDLTDYFRYTNSAAFIVLPGIGETDEYIGQKLFEATA